MKQQLFFVMTRRSLRKMSTGQWLGAMLVKPTSLGVCKPEAGDRYLTVATVIDPSLCAMGKCDSEEKC